MNGPSGRRGRARLGLRVPALALGSVLVLAVVGLPAPAGAVVAPDPVVGPSGWTPDGAVRAVVAHGDRVYVGGAFTGGVVALDADSGALVWAGHANDTVRAVAVSADGSHLVIGGRFNSVDGATHRKLALLSTADGSVEPRWKASAGGVVEDVVVVGGTAYIAGGFKKHRGMEQRSLGAVSVETGANVTDFTTATDGVVHALATDGSRLYVAGKFTAVDGQPRNQLASVTLSTGALDPWAPARGCTGCNLNWDVAVGYGMVYVAGRNYRAVSALDAGSGVRRWSSNADGDGQAVALFDGKVWLGGHFAHVGDSDAPRKLLAAFDPVTGALDPFSARFVKAYPGIWALAGEGSRLAVGGYFTAAGPKPNRYPYFAVFGST
jgi:outer membrane protein assembly factor BamB